jgi:hypothetical protein
MSFSTSFPLLIHTPSAVLVVRINKAREGDSKYYLGFVSTFFAGGCKAPSNTGFGVLQ